MKYYFFISILTAFISISCAKNNEIEIYNSFAVSLDNKITEEQTNNKNQPSFLEYFGEDTIWGNPKKIIEECYVILNSDSLKIDANCRVFELKNGTLSQVTTDFGINFYITFDEKYDEEIFRKEQNKNDSKSNTTIAYFRTYNAKGKILKEFRAYRNYRTLEIFNYDSIGRLQTQWYRNNYTSTPDSLLTSPINRMEYEYIAGYELPAKKYYTNEKLTGKDSPKNKEKFIQYNEKFITGKDSINYAKITEWEYTYDAQRNWTEKSKIDMIGNEKSHSLYTRKIIY